MERVWDPSLFLSSHNPMSAPSVSSAPSATRTAYFLLYTAKIRSVTHEGREYKYPDFSVMDKPLASTPTVPCKTAEELGIPNADALTYYDDLVFLAEENRYCLYPEIRDAQERVRTNEWYLAFKLSIWWAAQ